MFQRIRAKSRASRLALQSAFSLLLICLFATQASAENFKNYCRSPAPTSPANVNPLPLNGALCVNGQGSAPNCAKKNATDTVEIYNIQPNDVISFAFTSIDGPNSLVAAIQTGGGVFSPGSTTIATITNGSPSPLTYTVVAGDGVSPNFVKFQLDLGNPVDNRQAVNYTVTCTPFQANPSLTLKKSTTATSFDAVDEVITYSYEVKNDGNVPITEVKVTDNKIGTFDCGTGSLAVGATRTCTATYKVKQEDLDSCELKNTAKATGKFGSTAVNSNESSVTLRCTAKPALELTKSADPATYSAVGNLITYTYSVKNTGNVPITNITVGDDKIDSGTPFSCLVTLAAGATGTCTKTYEIKQADLDACVVVNTAQAKGKYGAADVSSNQAQATVTCELTPALELTKSASPTTFTAAGQTITYTYSVKNTGNVAVTNITVGDDKINNGTPFSCLASLAAGATDTCTNTYTVKQADLDACSIVNTAQATGKSGAADVSSNQAQATVVCQRRDAELQLEKKALTQTFTTVGQVIIYEYKVTNTGGTAVDTVLISDDRINSGTPFACGSGPLAPGTSRTCQSEYGITEDDLKACKVKNTAKATGIQVSGATPVSTSAPLPTVTSNEASATITCQQLQGALELKKTSDTQTYSAVGQTVTYQYTVKNVGQTTLTSVVITDNKINGGAPFPCGDGPLAVGASRTCSAAYIITKQDLTSCVVRNVARAKAKSGSDDVASAPAEATVKCDPDRTREVIGNFLKRRVDLLASNEPDRARLLRRFERPQQPTGSIKDEPMKLSGSSEGGSTRMSFATSLNQVRQANSAKAQSQGEQGQLGEGLMGLGAPNGSHPVTATPSRFDIWIEGHYQRFQDDIRSADRDGRFGVLYVGADYLISNWLLFGALVQFDTMDEETRLNGAASAVEGWGWMAGPYVSVKLSQNLVFDARGAWGQSENDVSPFGTYTDSFDTDRWLAKANLTGTWNVDRLRISPSVGVIYVEERQDAYTDSLGNEIDGQSAHIGRLMFGPEFGYPIELRHGHILEPHISVMGLWDFDTDGRAVFDEATGSSDDFRVKLEGGLMLRANDGLSMRGTVSYDGIGTSDYHAWGGQFWLNVPLN